MCSGRHPPKKPRPIVTSDDAFQSLEILFLGEVKQADRATVSMFKHLLGTEIFDRSKYDLVLDLGELSYRQAALLAIKKIESMSLHDQEEELAPISV